MDSLSTQKAKPRKMKVVVKKSLFYRVIEITVVMVTIAKLCYQLVITFENFGLARFLLNRHLAFVLGNTIIIALVAKCGFLENQEHDARRNDNDFYLEFVRESSRGDRSLQTDVICREKQSKAENEAKQSIEENRAKQRTEDKREKKKKTENREKQSSVEEREKDITVKRHRQNITQNEEIQRQSKSYEKSQSENLEGSRMSSCGRLKRSETERSADGFDSDDELRYKIESFIARQRRNQKDEEYCII